MEVYVPVREEGCIGIALEVHSAYLAEVLPGAAKQSDWQARTRAYKPREGGAFIRPFVLKGRCSGLSAVVPTPPSGCDLATAGACDSDRPRYCPN